MKPNNILVRVIGAIALALLILAASFRLTIYLTERRMENFVDNEARHKSEYSSLATYMLFESNVWLIKSFLTGMYDMQIYKDSATKELIYQPILEDETNQSLTADEIYDQLEHFVHYNYEFHSVVMIFEPGVLPNFPKGLAAKISPHDTVRHNLLEEGYEIYESPLYKRVEQENDVVIKEGWVGKDSSYVFTTGLSIRDEQGNVVGEFWADVDAAYFSDLLMKYKAKENFVVSFINDDCCVVASCNKENNGKYLKEIAEGLRENKYSKHWYSDVQAAVKSDTFSVFRNKVNDLVYVTYIMPITNSPFKLLLIKKEKTLYEDIERFIWTDTIIMLVTLALIALCLIYIFRVFKKRNDENNRMASELNIASTIQRNILPLNPVKTEHAPSLHNINSSETHGRASLHNVYPFDIYGFQRSAKSVGGDLYDFVQKGYLLHFCIGDVSGKGMPAALVMTEICSLYRYITNYQSDPKEIVTRMNKAVMERSDDSMFCTLFVGILNLRTGELQFCNAGHNPPILIRKTGAEYLEIKPNMPIYAFAGYAYQSETLQLNSGDRIFLYTDGVTEAKDKNDNFYGEKATLESIERHKGLSFNQLVNGVLDDINAFVKRAEQNDDITMLCLEYRGLQPLVQTEHAPSLHYDNIKGRVSEIVDEILNACQKPDDMKLRLAIEEPVQNIADYAYSDDGPLDVEIVQEDGARSVSTGGERETISIILKDSGKPFNPLESETPDLSVGIEEREVGGLGIFLTRQIMADVSYRYENGQNILILKYNKI